MARARLDGGPGAAARGAGERGARRARSRTHEAAHRQGRSVAAAVRRRGRPRPTRRAPPSTRRQALVAREPSRPCMSAESRRRRPRRTPAQAQADLRTAETAPAQITVTRARAASARGPRRAGDAPCSQQARAQPGLHDDRGADGGHRQQEVRRARPGRRSRASRCWPSCRSTTCGSRRTSRKRSCTDMRPGQTRHASTSTPTAASSPARSTASPPRPARASACCRRRTPPATT